MKTCAFFNQKNILSFHALTNPIERLELYFNTQGKNGQDTQKGGSGYDTFGNQN